MNIVYFSIIGNTQKFCNRLELPVHNILDGIPTGPSVLVVPTYGGKHGGIPYAVIKALNTGPREGIVGVVGTGNLNFGNGFARAGEILAAKLDVPLLGRVELAGTTEDVKAIGREIRRLN